MATSDWNDYEPIWTNGTPGTAVVTDPKYGAYGDGLHDDTAAIQAALDAASDAGGGTVAFPPGTYLMSTVALANNIRLTGIQAVLKQSSFSSGAASSGMLNYLESSSSPLKNVEIDHLIFSSTVASPPSASPAVFIGYGQHVHIHDCQASGFVDGAYQLFSVSDAVVETNTASNCGSHGGANAIQLSVAPAHASDASGNWVVKNNYVTDSPAGGINLQASAATNLNRCIIEGNIVDTVKNFTGIKAEASWAYQTLIIGNQVYEAAEGIGLNWTDVNGGPAPTTNRVADNVIANNLLKTSTVAGATGISLYPHRTSVTGNVIEVTGAGLTLENDTSTAVISQHFSATGNVVKCLNTDSSSTPSGIILLNCQDGVLSGNAVTASDSTSNGYAISAGSGVQNVAVLSNYIRGWQSDGIRIGAGSHFHINDNSIYDTGNGIVISSGAHMQVQNNRIYDTRTTTVMAAGIDVLSGVSDALVSDNLIGPVTGSAMNLSGTSIKDRNNDGYNPVGFVSSPSIPSSGTAQSNTYPEAARIYVAGGTVSDIKINGRITNLSSGQFLLEPGETITLEYTAAPNWAWILL